ncbi:MAG TPA: ferrous iron transport protein B [Leptospiraceae bacterium]|nr:ferrous iron transport protein B [Leptospiraceae bacterium]HNE21850.1 ferrous iron transport protein B [Leptospiraceae bacterium]
MKTLRKRPLIALVGNPNTGKTTVFNALCGTRQHVGNYPGVTVEKKIGTAVLAGASFDVLDLPGLYSLKAAAPDEQLASDALMGRIEGEDRPDLIVYVADATNLKRNLLVYSQLVELDIPVIIALTMTDLLSETGVDLNMSALEKRLKIPIVPVIGKDLETVEVLKSRITSALKEKPHAQADLVYPRKLEKVVSVLNDRLKEFIPLSKFETRNVILFPGDPLLAAFRGKAAALKAIEDARQEVKDIDPGTVTTERYRWAEQIVSQVEKRKEQTGVSFSDKLDKILTHKVLGLAAFVGVMFLVFQSIYTWASPVMDAISGAFDWLGAQSAIVLSSSPMLSSLVADGIIGGVGSVVVFLPQIILLFTFIAILEDSGYLARAAFLMDRLLAWSGLNGRAFIPMLSSFACAVPGVMASRVIPDARARMTTILVSPLMSCSARLPVYLLLIGAFIEPKFGAGWAAFTLFAMHAMGLLIALPIAWVLNRGLLKTPAVPFVLEMPPYRMPHYRNVFYRVYDAARRFLVRAGTVIFAMSIVIWALSYFPRPASIQEQADAKAAALVETESKKGPVSEERKTEIQTATQFEADSLYLGQSYLGRAGKFIQPVFAPLGFDWKITVGVLAAFPAREVIISALGIIYSVGKTDTEQTDSLKERMALEKRADGSTLFTPLLAVSLMVFFALCCQCMSTVVTVQRELQSWGWAGFMFAYMTGLAYLFALLIYQGGRAFGLS